jgi:hypothetical protein
MHSHLFIGFETPHSWLLIIAFILMICAALGVVTNPNRPINWMAWSFVFFFASMLFVVV